jgi:hypothetical protein
MVCWGCLECGFVAVGPRWDGDACPECGTALAQVPPDQAEQLGRERIIAARLRGRAATRVAARAPSAEHQ